MLIILIICYYVVVLFFNYGKNMKLIELLRMFGHEGLSSVQPLYRSDQGRPPVYHISNEKDSFYLKVGVPFNENVGETLHHFTGLLSQNPYGIHVKHRDKIDRYVGGITSDLRDNLKLTKLIREAYPLFESRLKKSLGEEKFKSLTSGSKALIKFHEIELSKLKVLLTQDRLKKPSSLMSLCEKIKKGVDLENIKFSVVEIEDLRIFLTDNSASGLSERLEEVSIAKQQTAMKFTEDEKTHAISSAASEWVTSNVAQELVAMMGQKLLIPEVSLLLDDENKIIGVSSQALPNFNEFSEDLPPHKILENILKEPGVGAALALNLHLANIDIRASDVGPCKKNDIGMIDFGERREGAELLMPLSSALCNRPDLSNLSKTGYLNYNHPLPIGPQNFLYPEFAEEYTSSVSGQDREKVDAFENCYRNTFERLSKVNYDVLQAKILARLEVEKVAIDQHEILERKIKIYIGVLKTRSRQISSFLHKDAPARTCPASEKRVAKYKFRPFEPEAPGSAPAVLGKRNRGSGSGSPRRLFLGSGPKSPDSVIPGSPTPSSLTPSSLTPSSPIKRDQCVKPSGPNSLVSGVAALFINDMVPEEISAPYAEMDIG